jgi:antitoxin ParD1/3/4
VGLDKSVEVGGKYCVCSLHWHILPMSYSGKERTMPTRNVVLTEQQAAMIERLVHAGRYQNASEVLRDGLRLVRQREAEDKARLAALRQAAQVGVEDFAAARFRSFADGETLRTHLAARAGKVLKQSSG